MALFARLAIIVEGAEYPGAVQPVAGGKLMPWLNEIEVAELVDCCAATAGRVKKNATIETASRDSATALGSFKRRRVAWLLRHIRAASARVSVQGEHLQG